MGDSDLEVDADAEAEADVDAKAEGDAGDGVDARWFWGAEGSEAEGRGTCWRLLAAEEELLDLTLLPVLRWDW